MHYRFEVNSFENSDEVNSFGNRDDIDIVNIDECHTEQQRELGTTNEECSVVTPLTEVHVGMKFVTTCDTIFLIQFLCKFFFFFLF